MSLCCIVGYKWVTVTDGVKFELNDMISLYIRKTILSENCQLAYDITKYIFDDIKVN